MFVCILWLLLPGTDLISLFRDHSVTYRVAQKSKPLPNDHKSVLNRINALQ